MIKNVIILWMRIFLHKSFKYSQKTGERLCKFAGITSVASSSKVCNFITSWKMIKTPQYFVESPSPIKLTKNMQKTEVKSWPQFPFNICPNICRISTGCAFNPIQNGPFRGFLAHPLSSTDISIFSPEMTLWLWVTCILVIFLAIMIHSLLLPFAGLARIMCLKKHS